MSTAPLFSWSSDFLKFNSSYLVNDGIGGFSRKLVTGSGCVLTPIDAGLIWDPGENLVKLGFEVIH